MRFTSRLLLAAALVLSLSASAVSAKLLPVHSIWSDNRPIGINDGETGKSYEAVRGYSVTSWQEFTPQAFSHAVGVADNGSLYEFRLTSVTSSDAAEILGRWDIYRNGVLVCGSCIGKVYGVNGAIGDYFKIYVGTPFAYAELWHFSAYITNRFDY